MGRIILSNVHMKKITWLLSWTYGGLHAVLMMLIVTGCVKTEHLSTLPLRDNFPGYLASSYRRLAMRENIRHHSYATEHFSNKGLAAAYGTMRVDPDRPEDGCLPPERVMFFQQWRQRLMALASPGRKAAYPQLVAALYVTFDCWMMDEFGHWELPPPVSSCRSVFEGLYQHLLHAPVPSFHPERDAYRVYGPGLRSLARSPWYDRWMRDLGYMIPPWIAPTSICWQRYGMKLPKTIFDRDEASLDAREPRPLGSMMQDDMVPVDDDVMSVLAFHGQLSDRQDVLSGQDSHYWRYHGFVAE